MPTVKINGVAVEVPDGTNMIEAAQRVGVEIPHYCYHPHLSVAGNCRMCLVEIEAGGRGVDIACNMKARDGLAIRTDTPTVKQMRKSVMEFLLVNHPLDCPICDQAGECKLQDYYMDHGGYESRGVEAKVNKVKRQDIGEHVVLDAERCVACSRCVRFGDEVTGTGDLRLFNRGDHTEIGMFPGEKLQHQYQGVLADICPVGALTSKDFRFTKRVWYLKEGDSLCTGCATGCNITVHHENGGVFRYTPRRNDAVNKSWMCDPGRATAGEANATNRLLRASVDGRKVDLDEAIAVVVDALRGARVGAVLGSRATNEANWGLLRVLRDNLSSISLFTCEGNDPGSNDYSDELLVSADKNPNSLGAHLLAAFDGQVAGRVELGRQLQAGIKLLLVLEDDVVGRLGGKPADVEIIYIGSQQNATSESARLVLPSAHSVEQDGSYTNQNGRVQRMRRAFPPSGDALPAWQLMERLGKSFGRAPGFPMAAAAFKRLAEAVPAYAGMSYQTLGTQGQPISPGALLLVAGVASGGALLTNQSPV